jgi:archaellum component FlaC
MTYLLFALYLVAGIWIGVKSAKRDYFRYDERLERQYKMLRSIVETMSSITSTIKSHTDVITAHQITLEKITRLIDDQGEEWNRR